MTAQSAPAHPTAATGQCPVAHGAPEHGSNTKNHGYAPFAMTDPFPSYTALRDNEPVMFDDEIGYFVVSRYDDVKAIFDNWKVFSSENAQAPVRARGAAATKIMNDGGFTAYSGLSARIPPEHTRMRAIVQKEFTPRRYKALEPTIRENTARLLQQMLAHPTGQGDFLKDVAVDIPTITILGLLGVGPEMVSTYKKWSDSRAAMTWGDLSDDEQIPHAHNLVDYWTECLRLVSNAHEQLAKGDNGDNLVFDLVQAQSTGSEISDHEIASVCYSLLFAGHETTTTLISNTIRELLAHPAEWQKLIEDPSRISAAIDETLRFSPSIVGWRRKALVDTEIGGVQIPAGSNILLLMGSANRDPGTFEQPEIFDINRVNARNHLSFGVGIHYCLGNMLAKMQDKIVVEETLKAAPGLRLIDAERIVFGDNLSFRAPTAVPVTWGETGMTTTPYIQFFDGTDAPRHDLLGGKCASLVALTQAGMPVPPGFAITTASYDAFIAAAGIEQDIHALLANLDVDDVAEVDRVSAQLRFEIESRPVPADVRADFVAAYHALQTRFSGPVPVAVRSSATAEDLPDASFAGQQDTYLWLNGIDDVTEHIRRCWASLFTSRAITYRLRNNIPNEGLSMAVAVQKMVNARAAGVAITMDPTTGDRSKIVMEASYGLGELVVSGLVTPDNVTVDKIMLMVVKRVIGDKHAELVPDAANRALVELEVSAARRAVLSISETEITAIATIAKKAEKHFRCPQDIEWALDRDLPDGQNLLLLQSRPETVHSSGTKTDAAAPAPTAAAVNRHFGIESITRSLLVQAGKPTI